MKRPNRDLLVLVKKRSMTDEAIEREVELINRLLFAVETIDNLCVCCECIDLDKRRISHTRKQIVQSLREKPSKPFVFVLNLN
ncbi:MAG: hypothetical protein EBZ67_07885 [Chitinophagia bacterium]|nr:hypothetical protein [Chitinophagia bacterium]